MFLWNSKGFCIKMNFANPRSENMQVNIIKMAEICTKIISKTNKWNKIKLSSSFHYQTSRTLIVLITSSFEGSHHLPTFASWPSPPDVNKRWVHSFLCTLKHNNHCLVHWTGGHFIIKKWVSSHQMPMECWEGRDYACRNFKMFSVDP